MDTTGSGSQTSVLKYRECICEAAADIFNTACGIEVRSRPDDDDLNHDGVIIAIISLVGGVDWSIFLGLPHDTATAIAAKFAGFEIPFESADMGDAVGELANILAGELKFRLDTQGIKTEISLPSVIRAESLQVLAQRSAITTKMCFSSPLGKLWTGVITGIESKFTP